MQYKGETREDECNMKKLAIGIQSGDLYDERNPKESVCFMKSCGFEAMDYDIHNVYDATFDAQTLTSFFDKSEEELLAYYEPLKKAMKENEFSMSQAHGVFPIYYHGEDARNDYIIEVTEKMMAACQYLECPAIVIHPWTGPDLHKDEEREINLNIYRRLIPAAKKYGVMVCLENMFKHDHLHGYEGACSDATEACWYIDTLNAEAGEELFGFCLDTGHLYLTARNLYQFITKLGKRLTLLHIHENNGFGDSHVLPYTQMDQTGKRPITDWEKFIKGLAEIGYEGALSFETFRVNSIWPKEIWKEGMCFNRAIGEYFRKRIEEESTCH